MLNDIIKIEKKKHRLERKKPKKKIIPINNVMSAGV
jgi:hypothetical protein